MTHWPTPQVVITQKGVQLQRGIAPWPPDQGLWSGARWGLCPRHHYRFALIVHHVAPPKLWTWVRQWENPGNNLLQSSTAQISRTFCLFKFHYVGLISTYFKSTVKCMKTTFKCSGLGKYSQRINATKQKRPRATPDILFVV